jgi:hypothetical protein
MSFSETGFQLSGTRCNDRLQRLVRCGVEGGGLLLGRVEEAGEIVVECG